MTTKITTTPTPLAVVDTINSIIDDKLDKTGTAASATTLSGLTATVTELNYVDGVTSNIQTQLNGKLSTSGKAASATTADTATTAGNVTGTVAVANGGTGATTAANARTNLGLSTAVTGASISGKVITLTKADGTTQTLTTQDTTYSLPTASASTLGGVKVGSGLSISSGVLSVNSVSQAVAAYKLPYATCSSTSTSAVATVTNGVTFSLVAGAVVLIKVTNSKSSLYAGCTLNVNSTGAKSIAYNTTSGSADMVGIGAVGYNRVGFFAYDGSTWHHIPVFQDYVE